MQFPLFEGKLFQPYWFQTKVLNLWKHYLKSVQMQSYFLSVVPVFGLKTEIQSSARIQSVFSPNTGKYGPEITPYLDTFHAVKVTRIRSIYQYFVHLLNKVITWLTLVSTKAVSVFKPNAIPITEESLTQLLAQW